MARGKESVFKKAPVPRVLIIFLLYLLIDTSATIVNCGVARLNRGVNN